MQLLFMKGTLDLNFQIKYTRLYLHIPILQLAFYPSYNNA